MCILLIGFMGAGKTTLLHQLKQHQEFETIPCFDLDEEIAKKMNESVEQVIMKNGIIWNDFVPGAKISIFIFKHFKIIDAV